ncbi:MAG: hypothetical protein HC911_17125 [Chloroflexaceae bacterium]|nr:hypothetical protein [Chloroflexaceae bacterium]
MLHLHSAQPLTRAGRAEREGHAGHEGAQAPDDEPTPEQEIAAIIQQAEAAVRLVRAGSEAALRGAE